MNDSRMGGNFHQVDLAWVVSGPSRVDAERRLQARRAVSCCGAAPIIMRRECVAENGIVSEMNNGQRTEIKKNEKPSLPTSEGQEAGLRQQVSPGGQSVSRCGKRVDPSVTNERVRVGVT